TNLLPQFYRKRKFEVEKAVDGMRQVLWGLFKKIVIADNCAIYANDIFANYGEYSGSTLLLGVIFFAFQIYGDFSGYSDIAIGTARLFGFNIMRNFAFPYFSRDIAEFWRRWHISLSTWFRDYLYIPLGGSRGGTWMKIRNTFIIFIVSGFWHGANWTFIIWGALNAVYFLPLLLTNNNRKNIGIVAKGKTFPPLKEFFLILITFGLTVFAWIFFRAESIGHAISYIAEIFSKSLFTLPAVLPKTKIIFIVFFIIVEWIGREHQYAIAHLGLKWRWPFRYAMYYMLIMAIYLFGGEEQQFIYFQF
ncbi:MAG: MBOAT family protein, partial [Bacteroidales bacterium]|nr:MBOAT family protein [Bacteroidales bacterium]